MTTDAEWDSLKSWRNHVYTALVNRLAWIATPTYRNQLVPEYVRISGQIPFPIPQPRQETT